MRILKLSVKVNPDGRPSLFHLRPGWVLKASSLKVGIVGIAQNQNKYVEKHLGF